MRRSRLVTIAFAITLLAGLTTAGLDPAAAAPSMPRVFIAAGDVADGQTIRVRGVGFEPSSELQFYECRKGRHDCQALPFTAAVHGSGRFGRAITVQQHLWFRGTQIDCALEWCELAVSPLAPDPDGGTPRMTAAVPLPFGPRPTVSITPNRALRDGETVRVTGVNLLQGQTVHVWECQDYAYLCTSRFTQSAVVDADGRVALDVPVRRFIHDYFDDFGDLPMDCAIEICHLALTLEGHEYEDGYGILALTRLYFALQPGLAGGNASAREGDTGTSPVVVPVELSPPINRPRLVTYRTLEWSAHAEDFEPATGTVLIPAGATTAAVSILVRGDTHHEGWEAFFVEFQGTRRASNAHAISIVWIEDTD